MSFARRVIRLTGNKPLDANDHDDPALVAASHIELATETETQLIGAPRASSLYDACMRQHVLGTVNMVEKSRRSSFSGKLTFGIGRAVHHWVQNEPDIFGDHQFVWPRWRPVRNVEKPAKAKKLLIFRIEI